MASEDEGSAPHADMPQDKSWLVRMPDGCTAAVADGFLLPSERHGVAFQLTRLNVPAPHRRAGYGTELMRQLCAWADAEGHVVELMPLPYPDSEMVKSQLRAFYARHGFVDDDLGMMMWRAPVQASR